MTTAMASTAGIAGIFSRPSSNASSKPAERLREQQQEIREHLLRSYSIGRRVDEVFEDLQAVRRESSQEGWDGYNANPLDRDAYGFALLFLEALPTTAPIPEMSVDSDGEIALDWIFGPRKALTVSIGPRGRCTFAWIYGQSTYRGTDWIADEIPANIAHALAQLTRGAIQNG